MGLQRAFHLINLFYKFIHIHLGKNLTFFLLDESLLLVAMGRVSMVSDIKKVGFSSVHRLK